MKKIQELPPVLYAFGADLGVTIWRVIRQVTLPNRRQKGNLLSSLFLLFVSLSESIVTFRQKLTNAPWRYGKKYIQVSMLAAAWLLFVLSCFEWQGAPIFPARETIHYRETAGETASVAASVISILKAAGRIPRHQVTKIPHLMQASFITRSFILFPPKRYLRLCNLRI